MYAGNYFGKIADKIQYEVIEWPSVKNIFYITITISGDQTKFSKYQLYDKTTSKQIVDENLPFGTYNFMYQADSSLFNIHIEPGDLYNYYLFIYLELLLQL